MLGTVCVPLFVFNEYKEAHRLLRSDAVVVYAEALWRLFRVHYLALRMPCASAVPVRIRDPLREQLQSETFRLPGGPLDGLMQSVRRCRSPD